MAAGYVDNRQASHTEQQLAVDERTLVVRAAMLGDGAHA
jgi:hypothetical protein